MHWQKDYNPMFQSAAEQVNGKHTAYSLDTVIFPGLNIVAICKVDWEIFTLCCPVF